VSTQPVLHESFAPRVAELVALFETIARTRMAGMPVLNVALRVEAVGFEPWLCEDNASANGNGNGNGNAATGLGILITPWFMNLVRLPLRRDASTSAVGRAYGRTLAGLGFEFIGAHEPAIGAFAACSLFSPVFEFADQAAARATAEAVLAQLRPPCGGARLALSTVASSPAIEAAPARRSFLFGRGAAGEARR
jgi:[NiFe] hydrogenase assembly HybE family chaperone